MSVSVPIDALAEKIAELGATAFLITASPGGQVHVVSAAPRVDGAVLRVGAGRTSRANIAANATVTLLWPRSPDGRYSLIVDAVSAPGASDADDIAVTPTKAVLHRLVDARGDGPSCIPIEG